MKKNNWRLIAFLTVLAFVGANLGFNDYVSVPIFSLVFILIFSKEELILRLKVGEIYVVIFGVFVTLIVAVILVSNYGEIHSALSQARELLMLIIVMFSTRMLKDQELAVIKGVEISGFVLSCAVFTQFVQIGLSGTSWSVPHQYFMLDYGNSLTQMLSHGYDYLRPTGFYSEPSVVSSVLVPSLLICLREKKFKLAIFIGTALLMTRSLYGVVGGASVLLYEFSRQGMSKAIVSCVLVSVIALVGVFSRFDAIAAGDDLSFVWRFQYPIEYITDAWHTGQLMPVPIDYLFQYSDFAYSGAAMFDNWYLYTIARLGLLSVLWFICVYIAIPRKILFLFGFYGLVSGAPLYHDKVIMMVLFGVCFKKVYFNEIKK